MNNENKAKFDAVLRRMTQMKPMSVKELSAKLKEEKRAKIMAAKPSFTTKDRVQKMDKSRSKGTSGGNAVRD